MHVGADANRVDDATSGLPTGFALGVVGYLAALVAFGYVGLFAGGADPADQLGAGLGAGWMVATVATVWVVVAAVRMRRANPRKAAGLWAGLGVGILLVTLLTVRIVPVANALPGGCDCSPNIDQIHPRD